jgi:hypothetical protein
MHLPNSSAVSISSGVGGRIRTANRVTLGIPRALGEHAPQFDLTRVGRLAVALAFAAYRLLAHHRHAGAVHLHLQNGNRLTHHDGQI